MIDPRDIERALSNVKDQKSFLRFLSDGLHWPLEAQSIEDASYTWSEKDLRTANLDAKVVDSRIFQIANLDPSQKWGIFVIEFKHADAFLAERGMTGVLRQVLRGLVPSRVKDASQPSWKRDHLLFICTHNYEHFRFAYFKTPRDGSKTAPLAAFGWGPDIPARTACEFNLPALEWPANPKDNEAWIVAWSEAFNVEKVTKRFYTDYAAEFEKIRKAVKPLKGEDQKMFTQTLLNRLMFLRFIERKGWLTAPGNGSSRDYLRLLFQAGGYRGKSFYAGRLRKLFFEALAVEGKQESEAVGKVPFLNGGLFEETELDKQVDDIDDKAFAPLLGPEGLFYRYNFTVQESTPLDIEVAVDPEMLGKVFEELVTGRHESGSYYTPRPVVSFMCREALKGYLTDALLSPSPGTPSVPSPGTPGEGEGEGSSERKKFEDAIAAFVDHHNVTNIKLADARKIAEALDNVRAVDPACGSGAYLLGLLHEIVDLYRLLYSDKLKTDSRALHAIKLDIIQNSLYGADIDPFATNIAMLRLWLSLTVDSENPEALPNLDFKIETGNSVTGPNPQQYDRGLVIQEKAFQLSIIKGKYLRAHGEEKQSLRRLIRKEEKEIAFELRSLSPGAIDWRVQFCEIFFSDRGGFDIVLANPPYIRQELIKDQKPELKKVYGPLFSGTADLYVFFYLRALQLLAPGGMLVFISSNKWFRAGYGEKLRGYVAKTASVKSITDFGELPVFETAATFPVIFVAQKKSQCESVILTRPSTLAPPYPDILALVQAQGQSVPFNTSRFSTAGWMLANTRTADMCTLMLKRGVPLETYIGGKANYGIKTGFNEAYYLDDQQRQCLIEEDSRSGELIRPLAIGDDIRKWRIENQKRWIILAKIGVHIHDYPAIFRWLGRWKERLKKRQDIGEEWWQLRRCAYYEVFNKAKIVFPVICKEPRFSLAASGIVTNDKTFIIGGSDYYLLGVLNSFASWQYLKANSSVLGDENSGGRLMLQWAKMRFMPIPNASTADRAAVGALAQKCLDAKGVNCEVWEKEIDERVSALYGIDLKDISK